MTTAKLATALSCLLCSGCGGEDPAAAETLFECRGPTMGSSYLVKWHGSGVEPAAVQAAVDRELAATDAVFSQWRDDSEIHAFSSARADESFVASTRLVEALSFGLTLAECTAGAFDPTVGPLSELYRRQRAGEGVSGEELRQAVERVGFGGIARTKGGVAKSRDDIALDLDGVVAGVCVDRLVVLLRDLGVEGAMVEVTGEVRCFGRKPDGSPWRIGIVDPEADAAGDAEALVTMPLQGWSLCTSGDYRNFVVVDGKVKTHVFDPRTGANPGHAVVSVSVLARSCAVADGLATALMVLGPEDAAGVFDRTRQATDETDLGAWFVLASPDGSLQNRMESWPEAFSLGGRPLFAAALPSEVGVDRLQKLESAAARHRADPDSVEAAVWHGRRLGYLSRFREAIAVYSEALDRHPDEPHLLRHRGHRYLSIREFDRSVRDLMRAAEVVSGQPDEVEPDGLPVAGRPPHSTLQFNIHYHLGLAHWCAGDAEAAMRSWRDCLSVTDNDESLVAVTHWLWCAGRRTGLGTAELTQLLQRVHSGMDVVENTAYHQLCLLYKGERDADGLAAAADAGGAALAYGLANHRAMADAAGGRQMLERVAAMQPWAAFGVIAAEADLER